MAIELTIRHVNVPGSMKQHAWRKAEALLEEYPLIENVHVIIDHQRFCFIAEVVAQGKHARIEASAKEEQVVPAVDGAFDRVDRQMRKVRTRMKAHRA